MTLVRALGCISGTSMDAIDVALVITDGDLRVERGPGASYPYPAEVARALRELLRDPARAEIEPLADLEAAVTIAHTDAIARFIAGHRGAAPELVGSHGQTVWHRPERRFTRQLGCGALMARRLHLPVVNRFRHADIAAGGQGAPLAPLYHQALARTLAQPLAVLNLGGVGNVTWLDGERVIAFDTGPASALLDDLLRARRGLACDEGGRLAASGAADEALLARLLAHPWFAAPPPKSLDRNQFHGWVAAVSALGDADAAATLSEFTARSVAAGLAHLPAPPRRWLVGGGGRHNTDLMRRLARLLAVPVEPVEAVGWDGDFLEAECFGWLAVRAERGLPLSLPTTTGVPRPLTGGELWRP